MGSMSWTTFIFQITIILRATNSNDEFCYLRPECNDKHWKDDCMSASKQRQSPIDLRSSSANTAQKSGLKFNREYKLTYKSFFIIDTGHSLQLQLNKALTSKLEVSGIEGQTFRLAQIHLHWGLKNEVGSEHTVNGRQYSAEIHFVHYNTAYKSFADALAAGKSGKWNAFAVLGVLIAINKQAKVTTAFKPVKEGLKTMGSNCGKLVEVKSPINVFSLMGIANNGFLYRYNGSLTTPPCTEAVVWSVFSAPIVIASPEMEALRLLKTCKGEKLGNNFRSIQKSSVRGKPLEVKRLTYAV